MASSNKASIYGTAQAKLSASNYNRSKAKQPAKIQVYCPTAIKCTLQYSNIL